MSTGARAQRQVDGILLLDKPVGMTSNRVLQQVKRLYQARKAGHTGSLDPLASGMLPICLGQATKVSAYLLDSDKTYRFRVRFGIQTATGDREGAEIATGQSVIPEEALLRAVAGFAGPMMQVPPMYSALKHEGRRLYELARAGETVQREARPVTIYSIRVAEYDPSAPVLITRCSKGTYIRSLAEDLATRLGTVGHVSELRRLAVAPFGEDAMVTLEQAAQAAVKSSEELDRLLTPLDRAVEQLPGVALSVADTALIGQGQPVWAGAPERMQGLVRLYDPYGRFLGLGECHPDRRIVPRRLMATGPGESSSESGL